MAANDGAGARDDADRLRRRRRPMIANRLNLFWFGFSIDCNFCFVFYLFFVVQRSFFFGGNKKIAGKKGRKKNTHEKNCNRKFTNKIINYFGKGIKEEATEKFQK
jgi:hypothetical protein